MQFRSNVILRYLHFLAARAAGWYCHALRNRYHLGKSPTWEIMLIRCENRLSMLKSCKTSQARSERTSHHSCSAIRIWNLYTLFDQFLNFQNARAVHINPCIINFCLKIFEVLLYIWPAGYVKATSLILPHVSSKKTSWWIHPASVLLAVYHDWYYVVY